jgi:hypothetical protein
MRTQTAPERFLEQEIYRTTMIGSESGLQILEPT